MLQAKLDRLYQDLGAIDKQLAQNTEALEAINEIYELTANGDFDPERNPQHMKLLEQAGITLKEYKENAQKVLADRVDELNAENDRLTKERQERVDQIQEIEQSADPDDVQTYYETNHALDENINARFEQIELQGESGVQNTNDRMSHTDVRHDFSSTDTEIGAFMKAYAEAKLIENDLERLEREQQLVQGLSDEAAELVSFEPETEHLFEEEYFIPLDQKQTVVTHDEAVVTSSVKPIASI